MLKASKDGVVNFGEPIELTKQDLKVLGKEIISSSKPPGTVKRQGKWTKYNQLNPSGSSIVDSDSLKKQTEDDAADLAKLKELYDN